MPDSPAWSGSCLPLHFYFIELSKSLGSNHNGFFSAPPKFQVLSV